MEKRPIKTVILAHKHSPTRALYLGRRLDGDGLPVLNWTLGEAGPTDLAGAFVIIVRYLSIPAALALWRAKQAGELAGVAYLLDDNMPAAPFDSSLPWYYRVKMAFDWLRWGKFLPRLADEFWLSSDYLVQHFSATAPSFRIDPWPELFAEPISRWPAEADAANKVKIFYHGEITHRQDQVWLQPVLASVLAACPEASFNIIGGALTQQLFANMDRVMISPAVPWSKYLAWSERERFDIGLAPLQDNPFSRARSWAKYVDIARFGAVGVFADGPVYRPVVQHNKNGLLLAGNDQNAWTTAIVDLVRNPGLRRRMTENFSLPKEIRTPPLLEDLMQRRG